MPKNPYTNPHLALKWERAVERLGKNWVLHPQSTYKPRWCAAKV